MIAFAAFLARSIPAMASYFMLQFRLWHLAMFAAVVGVVLIFLDKILLLVATVGGVILRGLVWVGARLLIWLLAQLPNIPDQWPEIAWSAVTNILGVANRYFPVDVFFNYMGLFAVVYGLIGVWKVMKFVRGGG